MKNKPLVSVIVPVYNVEEYIEECLESIINQTYQELEILVIEDGSTDESPQRIQNYLSDDRIIFIEQKNKGLSGARNTGMAKATGKYILFVDSDDYIDTNLLSELVPLMEGKKLDLIRFNGMAFTDGMEKEINQKYYDFSHRLVENHIYEEDSFKANSKTFVSPVYLYLTRKGVLTENNLTFREDIIHEDELFTPQVFIHIKTMMYVNAFYYYRRYRQNSIMTIQTPEQRQRSFDSYFKIFEELELLYQSDIYNKKQKKLIKRQMLSIYSGLKEKKSKKEGKQKINNQTKSITLKDKSYLKLLKFKNR
ncbi:glycosyltransferase [Carnobacterium funditum]|uniref:glycosyltransferase n=1 Tax=Carnobacterium funditum TaxID=2752 RepID=UPI0005554D5A|nr:glycosyltransferase [Carnobacterium funditum]